MRSHLRLQQTKRTRGIQATAAVVLCVAMSVPALAVLFTPASASASGISITAVVPNQYEQVTNRCLDYRYLGTSYVQLNPPHDPTLPNVVVKWVTHYHFCF